MKINKEVFHYIIIIIIIVKNLNHCISRAINFRLFGHCENVVFIITADKKIYYITISIFFRISLFTSRLSCE